MIVGITNGLPSPEGSAFISRRICEPVSVMKRSLGSLNAATGREFGEPGTVFIASNKTPSWSVTLGAPYVPRGEWVQPTVFRKNVRDVLKFGAPIFWKCERRLGLQKSAGLPGSGLLRKNTLSIKCFRNRVLPDGLDIGLNPFIPRTRDDGDDGNVRWNSQPWPIGSR
jgi:hypothetical protein